MASPLQARNPFLFVTAAAPAGTMGRLFMTECTYLPTYLPTLVCRTEAKEKLIDVKFSNILNSPHQIVISKNETWIHQNATLSVRQNTHIIISGRRGEAGAFEGVGHASVSKLHP